jgi:hypothetical protein
MKTFSEYLEQRDNDFYNEIKMPKFILPAIAGGALAIAGMKGLSGKAPEVPSKVSPANQSSNISHEDWMKAIKSSNNQSENLKEKAEKRAIEISEKLTSGDPLEQDDGNVYIKIPYLTGIKKEDAIERASKIGTKILRNKGYEVTQNNIVARIDRTGSIILVVKKLN